MAADKSSEDECCCPPSDFPVSVSFDEDHATTNTARGRCPLCSKLQCAFCCKYCIQNGDFTHSNVGRDKESLHEKIQKLNNLKNEKLKLIVRFDEYLQVKTILDQKHSEVEEYNQRLEILKNAITSLTLKLTEERLVLQRRRDVRSLRRSRCQQFGERVTRLQCSARHIECSRARLHERLQRCAAELADARRQRVRQLSTYIFPIDEVRVKSDIDVMELSTVSALAEARHTAYIRGRWVYSDIDGELQYKVVEPTLPSNGDYTPCFAWESKSTARSPDSETNQRNPAYTITAGLSNTSQFVSILTFYLDVILPRKQSYSEFCTAELSERAFARAVSKLNVNVLQLCFTQHVNPDLLHGQQTIRNLLLCLNEETSDLGRSGPFEVGLEIVQFVDDVSWEELSAATDSDGGGDDDDDDDDDLAGDWETVVDTNVPCAAEPSSVATRGAGGGESSMASVRSTTTRPDLHAHATPSIAGGLVSTAAASVASLWRWRTSTVVRKS